MQQKPDSLELNQKMLTSETHWVAPGIEKSSLVFPLSLDDKIRIFENRILGWQLNVAEQLYYGAIATDGSRTDHGIKDNGFAVLYILLSYFEVIPRYEAGDLGDDYSGVWFKRGVKAVFPNLPAGDETDILTKMWKGTRNGLYHSSMTSKKVFVDGGAVSIDYDAAKKRLVINPGVVAREVIKHFKDYILRLKNPLHTSLRNKFETKFDAEIAPQFA